MKIVKKEYKINASIEKVWKCLVQNDLIEKWSGAKSNMSEKEGQDFSLWDGDIFGKNTSVKKNKKLVQEWYSDKWDEPSIAEFTLSEQGGKTTLILVHTNIPDKEAEGIDCGWDDFFLEPLKKLAESL